MHVTRSCTQNVRQTSIVFRWMVVVNGCVYRVSSFRVVILPDVHSQFCYVLATLDMKTCRQWKGDEMCRAASASALSEDLEVGGGRNPIQCLARPADLFRQSAPNAPPKTQIVSHLQGSEAGAASSSSYFFAHDEVRCSRSTPLPFHACFAPAAGGHVCAAILSAKQSDAEA